MSHRYLLLFQLRSLPMCRSCPLWWTVAPVAVVPIELDIGSR